MPSWPWPVTSGGGSCALHVTANVVVSAPPASTVTVRGFAPLAVQFAATPDSATGWSPVGTVTVTVSLIAIDWLLVPSSVSM